MSREKMGGRGVMRVFAQRERDVTPILDGALADAIGSRTQPEVLDAAPGRTDHLLQRLTAEVPDELIGMGFDEEFLQGQFSTPATDPDLDLILLSAASDLEARHWVHREQGWIIAPPDDWESAWPEQLRTRFQESFTRSEMLSAEEYMAAVREVVGRVRASSGAHVLLVGMSTVGGEDKLSYHDRPDDHRLRAHRLNAAQIRLSMALGVSVVDVDRVLANLGAAGEVVGPLAYSDRANRVIAEEIADIIADIGFFEDRPLVAQVGQETGAA